MARRSITNFGFCVELLLIGHTGFVIKKCIFDKVLAKLWPSVFNYLGLSFRKLLFRERKREILMAPARTSKYFCLFFYTNILHDIPHKSVSGNLPYFISFLSYQEKCKSHWFFHALRKQVFLFWFFIEVRKNKKVLKNVLWALIRGTRAQNFNNSYYDLPSRIFQVNFAL